MRYTTTGVCECEPLASLVKQGDIHQLREQLYK